MYVCMFIYEKRINIILHNQQLGRSKVPLLWHTKDDKKVALLVKTYEECEEIQQCYGCMYCTNFRQTIFESELSLAHVSLVLSTGSAPKCCLIWCTYGQQTSWRNATT